jgi:hypothetical protein
VFRALSPKQEKPAYSIKCSDAICGCVYIDIEIVLYRRQDVHLQGVRLAAEPLRRHHDPQRAWGGKEQGLQGEEEGGGRAREWTEVPGFSFAITRLGSLDCA